jgi:SAM-dependent methyltransferase
MMYRYPINEREGDVREARQDPYKRLREMSMIEAMMSFPWCRAMDFGCGIGRNFSLFFKTRMVNTVVHVQAVEPDHTRLSIAQLEGAQLAHPEFEIDYVASLDTAAPSTLDLILCCQVIPHMPIAVTEKVLDAFALRLKPGGVLIVCIPIHFGLACGDFLHLVKSGRPDHSEVVRTAITQQKFDHITQNPPPGVLPVRAFASRPSIPISSNANLPVPAETPALFTRPEFRSSGTFVYSVHEFRDEAPVIGDLILKLVKD